MTLKEGNKAPDFCLPDAYQNEICLKDYKGKWVVLYFYPKDNTPGCTTQATDFSGLLNDFNNSNSVILGVSKDSPQSHQKFIDKRTLTINLLSDPGSTIHKNYGATTAKKIGGREFFITSRSTFLIDPYSNIAKVWYKVKPVGHAKEVLETIKSLG